MAKKWSKFNYAVQPMKLFPGYLGLIDGFQQIFIVEIGDDGDAAVECCEDQKHGVAARVDHVVDEEQLETRRSGFSICQHTRYVGVSVDDALGCSSSPTGEHQPRQRIQIDIRSFRAI